MRDSNRSQQVSPAKHHDQTTQVVDTIFEEHWIRLSKMPTYSRHSLVREKTIHVNFLVVWMY